MPSATHAVIRPNRTRATWTTYFQLGLWVWFMYSVGPSLQLINKETPVSATVLSIYGAGIALGGIIAGLLFTRLTHLLGRGRLLRVGTVVVLVAIACFTSGLPPYITILGPFIAGIGGTFIVAGCNAFLTESQGAAAPTAITEGNTIASAFGFLGPLVVGLGAAIVLSGWRYGLWLLLALFVLLEVLRGRNLEPYDARTGHPDSEKGVDHPHGGPMPRLYWWAGATLVLLVAVEFTLTTWGATLVRDQGGLGDAAAAAAIATLSGGMLVGRLVGSRLTERLSTELLFRAAILLAIVGFAVMWLSASGSVMLIGLAISGMGVGLHWPLGISRAIRASDGRPDRAGALVSIGVGVAASTGPILLGRASESWGVHVAFVIVPILLVIAFTLAALRRVPEPSIQRAVD